MIPRLHTPCVHPAPPRSERGAAAVEFALVVPILLAIVFGILDYGLWFNNAISVRQGVREGARQGVVAHWNDGTSCTSGTNVLSQLACTTDKAVGAINAPVYTKIVVPSGGWAKANPLLVCSYVKSSSVTGFTPLPAGGAIKASSRMSIESVPTSPAPPAAGTSYAEGPVALDWTWCR